jgi:transcriptional regulator with XRE-family HTH domain
MQKTKKGKKTKKRWADFTQDDIDKILMEKCTHCGYRGMTGGRLSCDYIIHTGHSRGCRPDKCNKFKKGIRKKVIVHPSLSRKKKKVSAYVYSSKRLKPPVTHFGKMLDDYMKAHKLVQRDFAELIGYKEDAVSGWRLGKRKPQKKAILAIAKQICVDEEIVRAEIERGLLDEFRSEKKEKEEAKEAQSEHYPEIGRLEEVLPVHA